MLLQICRRRTNYRSVMLQHLQGERGFCIHPEDTPLSGLLNSFPLSASASPVPVPVRKLSPLPLSFLLSPPFFPPVTNPFISCSLPSPGCCTLWYPTGFMVRELLILRECARILSTTDSRCGAARGVVKSSYETEVPFGRSANVVDGEERRGWRWAYMRWASWMAFSRMKHCLWGEGLVLALCFGWMVYLKSFAARAGGWVGSMLTGLPSDL